MTTFTELLGDKLLGAEGATSTASALDGKVAVALYFSAHWCGPCRGFTPKLSQAYKDALKAKGLEIVFVSSDRDQAAFDEYFGEMPFLALPYEARDKKNALSKKFKVQGIPTLVILDGKTGETITTDGREAVMEDLAGENFPWKPPAFWDALGSEFLSGTDGETVDVDEIKGAGKYIGLYFSAHWCPPCRQFTPMLVDAYTKHLKAKGLEIVFVSSDRDQASFLEYYGTMPWLAIPNGDKRKNALSKRFGVSGIPSFVIVDAATGETVNANARGAVSSDPTGAEFPWPPKPLNNLNDGPEGINEEVALCAMLEGCTPEVVTAAKAVLLDYATAAKAAADETLFFYSDASSGVSDQIRKLTKLGEPAATPQLVLLDIPDEGGFYVSPATEVTKETVSAFLESYKAKALDRQQLG